MKGDDNQKINVLVAVVLGFQVLFLTLLGVSFANLLGEGGRGAIISQDDLPSIDIEGLKDAVVLFGSDSESLIEHALYGAIVKNSKVFNYGDAKAIVDASASKSKTFSYQNLSFSNVLVDIPSIRQMYRIYYEDSSDKDNEFLALNGRLVIACPSENDNKYEEFDCRLGNDGYEKNIISRYLPFFNFQTFSVSSSLDLKAVYISILKEDVTKDVVDGYIAETKEAIAELGFDPSVVDYRTIGPNQYSYRN